MTEGLLSSLYRRQMMGAESKERRSQPANEHRITRTRNRVPLSCVACRVRKLKCNREKPCQNCVVRGDAAASICSYASTANPKVSGSRGTKSTPTDIRSRIDRLETLVRSLISQEGRSNELDGSQSNEFADRDPAFVGTLTGRNRFASESKNSDETERSDDTYIIAGGQKLSIDTRSTHWDAILHDITVIKDAWGEEEDAVYEANSRHPTSIHRPSLLSGLTRPPDIQTLVASLPPRASTDKLIKRFFKVYNPAIPAQFVIHRPTFLKMYIQHWNNPAKTKTIWVGLLFSILSFAMQSYEDTDEEPPEFQGTSKSLSEMYRIRAAQCITAADITRPADYMIETVLIYSLVEYFDQSDGDITVWMLSGLIMRIALKQGYHRDPSQHPDISPFQAEMRRRLWMIVSQHELLFAVQLGLPKMIRFAECDTKPPRSLYEEELDEDMKELPPSRPETEPTPISYQITKSRILRAYGYVIEHLHIVEEQSYESVMILDAGLLESHSLVPPHLRLGSDDEMQNEPPGSLMEKYILEHFYHKAICVLHRKYLNCFLADETYSCSRRKCIESALELLRQQVSLHSECQPGGRLVRIKWYRFSLIKHDFLLAAMVLCLAIYNDNRQIGTEETDREREISLDQRVEIFAALQHGKRIWADVVDDCVDSKRALTILTTVLDKLGMNELQTEASRADSRADHLMEDPTQGKSVPVAVNYSVPTHIGVAENGIGKPMDTSWTPRAYANTLGNFNSMISRPEPTYYGYDAIHDNLFSSGGIFNSFEPDLNVPANLDWAAWDLYINNGNRLDLPQDDAWSSGSPFQIPPGMAPYL